MLIWLSIKPKKSQPFISANEEAEMRRKKRKVKRENDEKRTWPLNNDEFMRSFHRANRSGIDNNWEQLIIYPIYTTYSFVCIYLFLRHLLRVKMSLFKARNKQSGEDLAALQVLNMCWFLVLNIIGRIELITGIADNPVDFNTNLNNVTGQIISTYFGKLRCLTFVTDELNDIVLTNKLERSVFLINLVENESLENELLKESFEQGCSGYIVKLSDENLFERVHRLIAAKLKTVGYRYNNQKYLFLAGQTGGTNYNLTNHPDVYYMPNFLLVMPNPEGTSKYDFSAVGHTFFNHYKHDVLGISHEILDEWSSECGFRYGNDLYPDRLKNVMGKKFVFGFLEYSPFSLVIEERNETIFDGFETRIVSMFVETMNGTWVGLDHPDLWGDPFPNKTGGTGVVGSVMVRRADFGYSAIYQWFCDIIDCTFPLYQSEITCLVPKPALDSDWLAIILPFAENTWFALIIVHLINTIFFFFLSVVVDYFKGFKFASVAGKNLGDSFFTIFRLQMVQIPKTSRNSEPSAVFIRIMVFYYFFVATFWQGGIASILTVPRFEKPIDSTLDLLARWPKVEWGASSKSWVNSIRDSTDEHLVQIVNKFVVLDDEKLIARAKANNFGYFMEKLPHGHYGFSSYINEETVPYLRLMKNRIYTAFGVFILPRGSPFLEKFDHWILRMIDSGMIHKMEIQVVLERINNRLQIMIGSADEKPRGSVVLAVRHIRGPLYIYFMGISFASIVLIIEILSKPNK